jgi:dipeptidyl aminopeptidase/acylaminoacyl peptidase
LQQRSFGEASIYHWKDRTGTEWTGGLLKPVGYIPGKRYPLVIQMYQFNENEFITDGTDPSAFAARHLASAGFVVLQIRKKPSVLSEADPQTHLEAYRSAIESLSGADLIDPGKVGVVGFSWTCWYVVNALIKAPKLFAAATIADGLDNSYMQYVLFGPGPANTHEQMDRIRGGSPFGPGLERWIEQAPGFHLDQVHTPVRIEAINPTSVLQEWELYASLYMQHKPVDLIYFPEGTHIHQRPLERLESQQGSVDWLRFWLQGYEDPDPNKRSQYQRWQEMKANLQAEGTAVAKP